MRKAQPDMWWGRHSLTCDEEGTAWHVMRKPQPDMWWGRHSLTCDEEGTAWHVMRKAQPVSFWNKVTLYWHHRHRFDKSSINILLLICFSWTSHHIVRLCLPHHMSGCIYLQIIDNKHSFVKIEVIAFWYNFYHLYVRVSILYVRVSILLT
jgi:hypothetical protein